MDARRQQLLAKPRSPIVRAYKWSADSGGVLYLLDISNLIITRSREGDCSGMPSLLPARTATRRRPI